MRSGQVAEAAGVNLQTLRYYERRGLLAEPERTVGGHRMYRPEAVTVVRVIKAAQRLGFSLDEVADLLAVGVPTRDGRRGRGGLQAQVADKLDEVEARITDLAIIRDTLRASLGMTNPGAGAQSGLPLADLAQPDRPDRDAGS